MQRLQYWAFGAASLIAILATTDAYAEHPGFPGIALFLFFWAPLPTLIFACLCVVAARKRWTGPLTVSVGGATLFISSTTVVIFTLLWVGGPPDPDTAAHMAPFLWPLMLFVITGVVAVVLYLVALVWDRVGTTGRG
jgi:hypothetical protein